MRITVNHGNAHGKKDKKKWENYSKAINSGSYSYLSSA